MNRGQSWARGESVWVRPRVCPDASLLRWSWLQPRGTELLGDPKHLRGCCGQRFLPVSPFGSLTLSCSKPGEGKAAAAPRALPAHLDQSCPVYPCICTTTGSFCNRCRSSLRIRWPHTRGFPRRRSLPETPRPRPACVCQ